MDGSIGFSMSQSVQFYLFVHLSSKINFIQNFEHCIDLLLKKSNFMNLFLINTIEQVYRDRIQYSLIPFQNEPSGILVGPKLEKQLLFECRKTSLFRRAVVT